MRIASYARYSSDLQRDASLDDQHRNCRAFAERHGWPAPAEFGDAHISGARSDRPGYQRLLARIGEFDVLLVDDLSRLSRDKDELGRIVKRLTFGGVRLIGVSDGVDTARKSHKADVGLRGLMSELYLDDLADKTHRGLAGRALAGASAGGLAYGYRVTETGQRAIDDDKADVVRRIFRDYIAGKSPRTIAAELNNEGIPSPRGGSWSGTSIAASKRGLGILGNEAYIGRQVWNRSRWVKHPDTGRRLRKENPRSEWIVTENPDLAIIDRAQWDASKSRAKRYQATPGGGPGNKPRHLLSGLLRCESCSGPIVMVDANYYACARAKNTGYSACDNHLRVRRTDIEGALLAGIQRDLLSDAALARMQSMAVEALKRAGNISDALARRLAAAARERDNIMTAIRAGIITATTRTALEAAEADVADAERMLEAAKRETPATMIPRLRDRWRAAVAAMADTRDVTGAREAIHDILGEMTVINENGAISVEITPRSLQVADGVGSGGAIQSPSATVLRIAIPTTSSRRGYRR